MNKLKSAVFVGAAAAVAAVSILAAQAQTASLAVSCAGAVSNNQVTWTATPVGGNAPYAVLWSGDPSVAGATGTSLTATYSSNGTYTAMVQATDASSTVATSTCSATVSSVVQPAPVPVPTPPLPRVNPPMLSIGPQGAFLAHGMTVTSVASGSFQAQVWGITYTVNWSGNSLPELLFRKGNDAPQGTSPTQQVQVGDEVGVAGRVSSSSPMTVTASVVRDYSIASARPAGLPGPFANGLGNASSGNGGVDLQGRMNDLMNQLRSLQNLFKGRGGGN